MGHFVKDLFTELNNQTWDLKRVTFAGCTVYGLALNGYSIWKFHQPFNLREYCECVAILIGVAAASQAAVKKFGAEEHALPLPPS